ncbi:hypothetical protein [Haloferula sp. BvORR071]|uniref:hypothetical protein n=1 Tax=Haloferula sp. BvORR071 TaxID=1396141 RepID=UPI000695C985|nr:hypothetical protein [Haloferula sp. BvORR071]
MERRYEKIHPVTETEVLAAIARDDVERLRLIPIELGMHHQNWKFIQDIAVRLSEHPDPSVRHNALLGIEYAARFRGRVEKNIVKPVLLRALRDQDPIVVAQAETVVASVNRLMGWKIGGAKAQREREARYEAARPCRQEGLPPELG